MSFLPELTPCPNCGGKFKPVQVSTYSGAAYATVVYHWMFEPEAEKPPPESESPVISGSVIGYRAWRIKDWQLRGTAANRAWVPGVNEATCDPGRDYKFSTPNSHPAPSLGCHCGLTALARFAEQDVHWQSPDVFGAIEAWSDDTVEPPNEIYAGELRKAEPGQFILHGTGFRSQYGKVVLLTVEDDWPTAKKAAVRALAREHDADVCKRIHLEDAAKEHGQLIPDEMLEWARA